MTEPGWDRIEALFAEAAPLSPPRREAFLDRHCAEEPALRRRLEALLAAHDALNASDGTGGFLESLDPRAGALLEDMPDRADREGRSRTMPAAVGRYEVVRELGRGGMGVVYLARDPALDRPVALKLLSGAAGPDPGAERRLLGEARAASALDHPNIGTVYEVGEAEQGRYLAMAYYEGETLRQRIARGRLAPDEAAGLAAQLADGLAAAHARGIVHRDIKPENLIVTSAGLLKIVDFGVAHVAARTATLTRAGAAPGTVGYMSPEQTRGERVEGATDVWALGVVLYEMLTGGRPFTGERPDVVLYAIRNDAPVPLRSLRSDISPAHAAVVARCLEKDPERRFGSAREVAEALRGISAVAAGALPGGGGATSSSTSPPDGGLPSLLTWPRAAAAAAVVAILLIAGTGLHVSSRALGVGPAAPLTARGLVTADEPVILADFMGAGADPRLARVVTEALRIDLLQSPVLRLAEGEEVVAALRRMEREPGAELPEPLARELALREGYKAVVAGDVGAMGGGYVLTARIVAAEDGSTLAAFRETARDSTLLIDAVDRLSKRVRERAGESLRALRSAEPLPRVATASLPALRRYAEAYRLGRSGGDETHIARLLEEAVALDSTFAGAHRALATTYWNLRADRTRTLTATRAAYDFRHRLPERERFLTEAAYHWQVLGDPAGAASAYRRVLALKPADDAARSNLALALLFQGQPGEAERVLRAAPADRDAPILDPLRLNLARAYVFQGRTEAGLALLDSLSARPGGSPAGEILRVRLLGGAHRWAAAEAAARALLEEHGDSPQVRAESLRALWHVALVQGRLRQADSLYARLESRLEEMDAPDALARAEVQRAEAVRTLRGDGVAAKNALRALLERPGLDVLTAGATLAPRLAAALAAAGDPVLAAELVDRWEALPLEARGDPDTFSPELARARVELDQGRPDQAARRLSRIVEGDIQAIHYLPDLAIAHERAGRPHSAIAALERYLDFRHTRRLHRIPPWLGPALARLAALYEETGDTARALTTHARLVDLWNGADAELQPEVEHSRRRIAALSRLSQ